MLYAHWEYLVLTIGRNMTELLLFQATASIFFSDIPLSVYWVCDKITLMQWMHTHFHKMAPSYDVPICLLVWKYPSSGNPACEFAQTIPRRVQLQPTCCDPPAWHYPILQLSKAGSPHTPMDDKCVKANLFLLSEVLFLVHWIS